MTTPRLALRLAPFVLLALGFACKPGDEGKEYGDVPQADGPATYAEVYCHLITACDCELGVTEEECVATISAEAQMEFDAATAAGLTYSGDCLGNNLEFVDSLGCGTISDLIDNPDFADFDLFGCKVFSGTATEGEACTDYSGGNVLADSCAQGLACFDSVCVTFSTTPPVKQLGESCDPQAEICEDGAICTPSADFMTFSCVALPVEGESCMLTGTCAEPSWCDFNDSMCKAPLGQGDACEFDGCGDGLFCSETTMVCELRLGEGGACLYDDECSEGLVCADESVCRPEQPLVCGG